MTNTRPLRNLCENIFTGLAPRLKASLGNAGSEILPIVGIRSVTQEGKLDIHRLETFHLEGGKPSSILPLQPGDVLMTIRGSTPKATIVEQPFDSSTFASGNLAVLRPDTSQVDARYLWSFIISICRSSTHPLLTRATTQQLSIRISNLTNLQVPLPSLERQKAVGAATLALRDALIAQQEAIAQGERTFEAFLNANFSK